MLRRRNKSSAAKKASAGQHYGCEHYSRKCAFVTPCCQKIYACRVCHDEQENHKVDRHCVSQIVCLVCSAVQKVGPRCEHCRVKFAHFFCQICRMYDDVDKKQFHCEKCGLCRVGGKENFFHCEKCDMCMCKDLKDSHKCVEQATRGDCPVCLDDLHTSRASLHVMTCGHVTHEKCWFDMLKKGEHCDSTQTDDRLLQSPAQWIYACPLCGHSMLNLESVWRQMDLEISRNPMPEELRNKRVWIHCKDCNQTNEVIFHRVGLKCTNCRSYNTSRTDNPRHN